MIWESIALSHTLLLYKIDAISDKESRNREGERRGVCEVYNIVEFERGDSVVLRSFRQQ